MSSVCCNTALQLTRTVTRKVLRSLLATHLLLGADWKLVNSIPAAAVHLSILSVHLHDRLLSLLVPGFVQTQTSDVSSDLAPGPHSPCYLTTAPTDDSDSEAHPAYYCGQHQPHSHGTADPHAADSCPSNLHRWGVGGGDDKALGGLLRCAAKQDELLCRWTFTRLRRMLQRTSELTADLLNRQVCSMLW